MSDRSYYRGLTYIKLREEVNYGTNICWQELAIALLERLDTLRAEVYDEIDEQHLF